jgi:hypothetical protein
MHTHLYKRTYPIYTNAYTYTHPLTNTNTHTRVDQRLFMYVFDTYFNVT